MGKCINYRSRYSSSKSNRRFYCTGHLQVKQNIIASSIFTFPRKSAGTCIAVDDEAVSEMLKKVTKN